MADEIVQVVRVMDALNQVRFADDGELLPAWESAANIVTPRIVPDSGPTGDVPPAGEVKPAARLPMFQFFGIGPLRRSAGMYARSSFHLTASLLNVLRDSMLGAPGNA